MKKTRIFSMVFAIGLLGLVATGCSPSSGGDSPDVKKETHTAKSADLIKFKLNVTNAKYLATQWADETDESKARAAFARKASREGEDADTEEASPLDTLVAVVENADGELVEETVLEVPAEELKLADWCVPQPVREIYQCPYTTAEKAAKGIYTVFACYIDWWKYTDDTPAPGISMLMYQKPDGTTVDVLNKDGKVKFYLTTWQKENEGEDYIQFDKQGNLFALAHDDYTDEYVIFRFHPDTDDLTEYRLTNIKGKQYIRNFKITPDGKWIFLNVMVDEKKNNVYAVQVTTDTAPAPISMYEYKTTEVSAETSWAVSSIGINPKGYVYWYVDDYNDWGRPNAGLYVAEADVNGNYSSNNVTHYHAAEWWQILDFVKTHIYKVDTKDTKAYREDQSYRNVIPASANTDYSELLDYLKGLCAYKGDIELNFSAFADMENVECSYDDENGNEQTYSRNFKKLADKNLKDEAALKYLFETSLAEYDEIENPNEWDNYNLFSNLIDCFYNNVWCRGLAASEGFAKISESSGYAFPLQYIMFQKGTKKSAYIPEEDDVVFFKSAFGSKMNGIILTNNEGTWVLSDIWDENKINADGTPGNNTHSTAFRLTDLRGNFKCDQPGKLATLKFSPRWDYDFQQRDETDPWYQNPVVANTTGIAALSSDKTTIYYQTNDETINLLANDSNIALCYGIYSFRLQEDKLIYNAVKKTGGYITVSVDLATGATTKLPLEKQVESMLGL